MVFIRIVRKVSRKRTTETFHSNTSHKIKFCLHIRNQNRHSAITLFLKIQRHVKHLVYIVYGFLCEDSWLKQIRFLGLS